MGKRSMAERKRVRCVGCKRKMYSENTKMPMHAKCLKEHNVRMLGEEGVRKLNTWMR